MEMNRIASRVATDGGSTVPGTLYQHFDSRGGSIFVTTVDRQAADLAYLDYSFEGADPDEMESVLDEDYAGVFNLHFGPGVKAPGEPADIVWLDYAPNRIAAMKGQDIFVADPNEAGIAWLAEKLGVPQMAQVTTATPEELEDAAEKAMVTDPSINTKFDDDAFALIYVPA